MESHLSVVRYFFGVGGSLLSMVVILMVFFLMHIRVYDTANKHYETVAMIYIGAMLGLTLIFLSLPTMCFIKSTLMCYRVM